MVSSEESTPSEPASAGGMVADSVDSASFAWVERVASRYFSIWIWSIVVGVSTSTTLSLTAYLVRSKGTFLNILIVPLFMFSALSLLAGWWAAIRFFDTFILKLFLADPSEVANYPPSYLIDREHHDRYRAGHYLRMSVRYAFVGLAFRLMLSFADILLSSPSF